jgi:hypothetical protein
MVRFALFLSPVLMLASCGGDIEHDIIPDGNSGFKGSNARQCLSALKSANVRFSLLPNKDHGRGCRTMDTVQLISLKTQTTNLGAMTCTLASAFTTWSDDIVAPAARRFLGSPIARIETSGTYSCRRVNGNGSLSQHAFANAVDVFAFVTQDGQRVTVLKGWNGSAKERAFLQHIHEASCGPFRTVLGPNFNAQHRNHFHFDMAASRMGNGKAFCR